ncbi:hypothetical protein AK812_SmicGene1072 [Symbiodinium microadriaticum]|uniref:Ubiquitin-like domain-containing protein n=1 Tax=Symbiodinium microadriaticum TaxID=2951 RepID=A0A1Q9F548_SYMMI|nr:hypothetical protein AK812_SmicGene1072 [Symbiodinium microadriaticum]
MLSNPLCDMSITVEVALLSGRAAAVKANVNEKVDVLMLRAQTALGVGKGRLVNSSGVALDVFAAIDDYGVRNGESMTLHINRVQASATAFAFAAILGDGSVVTWGGAGHGGDSSAVQDQLKNVQHVHASHDAFAAILGNGSVVTWGHAGCGGDSSAVQDQLKNVQQIQATKGAFAAILGDGSVLTWGDAFSGGDSSAVQDQLRNVQQIHASAGAFAAILGDGSVVTWGDCWLGGDSVAVQAQLRNVQQIRGSGGAFAAILGDESVVAWGNAALGGDCIAVQDQLKAVQHIQASAGAFAAILGNGSVVTWGGARFGGDSSVVQALLEEQRRFAEQRPAATAVRVARPEGSQKAAKAEAKPKASLFKQLRQGVESGLEGASRDGTAFLQISPKASSSATPPSDIPVSPGTIPTPWPSSTSRSDELILEKIRDGSVNVHPSRLPASSTDVRIMCNNIQRRLGLSIGVDGGWNPRADASLLHVLQKKKRDNKRKALALEDTPHKMLAIEDTPEANRPVDVPAPDGTHANDSNDHIDNDIPAQVHAPEADAVAKQQPVQDKDQGNHNDSEDSSSNSSSSESDSVPNVNTSAAKLQDGASLTLHIHKLQIQSTSGAFAAIVGDGSVVTWGSADLGGDSNAVQNQLNSVQHIQASRTAFAAILGGGSVVTWGLRANGGDSSAVQHQLKNVQEIQASDAAFAAILGNGNVVTWGRDSSGGDSHAVQDQLRNVQQIQATRFAFAAILDDGSVVTWGSAWAGGDSSAVQSQLKSVSQIQASLGAFAAILGDGSVVTWGDARHGGNSSILQHQLRNAQHIQATRTAFAAILGDGSVVTWGDAGHGGDSSAVQHQLKNVQQSAADPEPAGRSPAKADEELHADITKAYGSKSSLAAGAASSGGKPYGVRAAAPHPEIAALPELEGDEAEELGSCLAAEVAERSAPGSLAPGAEGAFAAPEQGFPIANHRAVGKSMGFGTSRPSRPARREAERPPENEAVDGDFLRRRGAAKQQKAAKAATGEATGAAAAENLPPPDKAKALVAGKLDRAELQKLQWTMPAGAPDFEKVLSDESLPPEPAGKALQLLRFDFAGQVCLRAGGGDDAGAENEELPNFPFATTPVETEMFFLDTVFGSYPYEAGYTLAELLILSRSAAAPQRALALTALGAVLRRARAKVAQADLLRDPALALALSDKASTTLAGFGLGLKVFFWHGLARSDIPKHLAEALRDPVQAVQLAALRATAALLDSGEVAGGVFRGDGDGTDCTESPEQASKGAVPMKPMLGIVLLTAVTSCSASSLALGVLAPLSESRSYLAALAALDIDMRKHFEVGLAARFGPPVLGIQTPNVGLQNVSFRMGTTNLQPESSLKPPKTVTTLGSPHFWEMDPWPPETSERAFAAVLLDGSVVTWGNDCFGGNCSAVQEQLRDVQQIQACHAAFAAILADGSVVTWGHVRFGGDSSAVQDQLRDVQQIQASDGALAAILGDGSVVTWGDANIGGDSGAVQDQLRDVQQIQACQQAFAAILRDGSVVTWGYRCGGGSSEVQDQLRDVQQIQASRQAFAAILGDGSVVAWGNGLFGGDSSAVQEQLRDVLQIQACHQAFAAILADGSVVTWGDVRFGGDSSAVQDQLRDVQQIQASGHAFAAILGDGSVVIWGSARHGGDSSEVQDQLRDVQQIQASYSAFAAILRDGSVVTWGNDCSGGDCSAVQDQLQNAQQIQASFGAFAAILGDGSVVTWGNADFGGDSSAVQVGLATAMEFLVGLDDQPVAGLIGTATSVVSVPLAILSAGQKVPQISFGATTPALSNKDGSLLRMSVTVEVALLSGRKVTVEADQEEQVKALKRRARAALGVGNGRLVDSSGSVLDACSTIEVAKLQNGTSLTLQISRLQIQSSDGAFAAILGDGSVATWGRVSDVQDQLKNVQQIQIQATDYAFAAILGDGSVVTWGDADIGGDSSAVQDQLKNVQQIQATRRAFAAILADGSVVTWGDASCGGDSTAVQQQLQNVQQIQATWNAFAAILGDGSIGTCGHFGMGGDSSAVQHQLKNVQQIQATARAFAAILADGSVVTWGCDDFGGDSSRVQDQLKNIKQIQATGLAFAAILREGSVVTWGHAGLGGDSSAVQDQLKNVQQIQATHRAFAAILADGSIVTWVVLTVVVTDQLKNVQQIQETGTGAFAAILGDGSVVTWGESYPYFLRTIPPDSIQSIALRTWLDAFQVHFALCIYSDEAYGRGIYLAMQILRVIMSFCIDVHLLSGKHASVEVGTDASVESLKRRAQSALVVPSRGRLLNSSGEVLDGAQTVTEAKLTSGDVLTLHVKQVQLKAVHNNGYAGFAALLGDGSVATWGKADFGGDSSAVQEQLQDVQQMQTSERAFAAILLDGSVVTWGNGRFGGDSSAVQEQLRDVQQFQACHAAFAAILADGSVVTWGDARFGGDCSVVQDQLRDVQQIQASAGALAAIVGDGSVVTWGDANLGGDSGAVQDQLRDVQQIQACHAAFAAILRDGSVVTWGYRYCGDSSAVQDQLRDVQQIQASFGAFAAILGGGSVVTWVMPTLVATAVRCRISCEMRSRSKLLLAHLLQSWVMDLSSLGGMPISAATAVLFRISCYV